MSITTQKGDAGETSLLYGHRVPKDHPRIQALGAVDELTSALGLARLGAANTNTIPLLESVQRDLISLMGVLAVLPADYPRYLRDGFAAVDEAHVARLTKAAQEVESALPRQEGWALPGSSPSQSAAHLEMARAICRRAERCVAALRDADAPASPHLLAYLNRLADLLWLLARLEEGTAQTRPPYHSH